MQSPGMNPLNLLQTLAAKAQLGKFTVLFDTGFKQNLTKA